MLLATILSTFLAGCVESAETVSVVLAVGLTRGWRSAWAGIAAGLALLGALLATLGVVIVQVVPLRLLNLVLGTMLLLFGLRWLAKATLRYAGKVPMRDERAAFSKAVSSLSAGKARRGGVDKAGAAASFGSVVLEGSEVAFTVIAFGARPHMMPFAVTGALAGALLIAGLALALRAPLVRVPENGLKFVVGVMLSALGTTWTAEGMHLNLGLGAATYPVLAAVYLAVALVLIRGLSSAARAGRSVQEAA
ncbi:MAG: hypothetical protein ACYDH5_04855 [Acidimicrobiales bacterium]